MRQKERAILLKKSWQWRYQTYYNFPFSTFKTHIFFAWIPYIQCTSWGNVGGGVITFCIQFLRQGQRRLRWSRRQKWCRVGRGRTWCDILRVFLHIFKLFVFSWRLEWIFYLYTDITSSAPSAMVYLQFSLNFSFLPSSGIFFKSKIFKVYVKLAFFNLTVTLNTIHRIE